MKLPAQYADYFAGGGPVEVDVRPDGLSAEFQEPHRQYATHLDQYYDKVIAELHQATSVLIFGPGEAKGEFKKRMETKGLSERVAGVETTDKMTDNQIAAKVREFYKK